jgi:hypothetical protein
MVHKQTIMSFVIINIVMNFLENSGTLRICWVEVQVHSIGDMHQNTNLEIVFVHVLHFTLCFECIILRKVNARNNGVIKNIFQKGLEFLYIPQKVTSVKARSLNS